ncbi:accessory Sec-dependent serine-rich glycoprotein adhesin, partial [Streptococcus mitis]|uniref:accessory Sec-dependent serine-rich glycoprotein adhesin n=1 Tax=Streptococcus mitis TaxID=28037 RepID=UPI0021B74552
MFFRRQKGEYRETDRVTRFKLIKSGKHWLRASTSQFGLFKVLRGGVDAAQVTTEMIEEQSANKLTGLDILKGIAAAGTVLGGAVATQTTVYANDALEKTVESNQTLANTDTVTLGTVKDQEGAQADSLSVSVSQSQSLSEEASKNASKHLSESESQSVSTSTSASVSASTSASESASTSASESASTSASQSQAGATSELAKPATSETASNKETSVRKEDAANATADAALSKVITDSLASLQAVETRLSQITSTTSSLVDTTTTAAVAATVSAESNKKAQEDRKRLSKISADMSEYLAKSIGLPNTTEAVAKVNAAVTAIEDALKIPGADLTDVIKQATLARNSIANAVLRAHNGKRSVLNGRPMERGVSFREVAPENTPGNTNMAKATVAYVISEAESKSEPLANGYKPGTYIYATQGRQANNRPPEKSNVPTRVEVRTIRSQVYMTSHRQGTTTNWEVTFNESGDRHDNPYFYFTVPKGHNITHMEVYQKDNGNSNSNWNLLGSSNDGSSFLHNSKSGDLLAAVGNTWNNQGGSYYENVAGVGPNGVGRGSLTSLRDFAFNNPSAYYQTDKISETVKQAGDFAFNTIESATANVYALHPKGSARQEGYKIKFTTTSPENTDDFYMAGFRSLEDSRHRNYLQMNGSNERYALKLKTGVPSTFLKYGKLNDLTNANRLNAIANAYDRLTGDITEVPPLEPGQSITYAIRGRNESSSYIQFLANTKEISFSKGEHDLRVTAPKMGTRTLPFRIITQADAYEPVINKTVASSTVSKGQVVDPVSIIQKIDDKSRDISGFEQPYDMELYNSQINGGRNTARVLPNTTAGTGSDLSRLNVKNVEWVGGNEIGSGIGEKMAVKAIVNGKEVYLPVPEDMDISRLGSPLSAKDKQAILAHNDLQGNAATITGTKVGLTKQLKTIYKDDEDGDSVDVSEVFFENVEKARATAPRVDPKSDGSVVVSPVTDNDKINISYTPTTPTTANTPTQITIKKSGTTWENSDPLPAGVTLDKSTGNVTISEEAVKDNTPVNAMSYNFNSDGATTTATAKAPYRAKTDRFYAVEGENPSQLNARDFVVDGNGGALPSTTTVTWKPGTLDLSTPGTKKATLLVTKGSDTKEVEYNYTVLKKVKAKTENGVTGKFFAFKGTQGTGLAKVDGGWAN